MDVAARGYLGQLVCRGTDVRLDPVQLAPQFSLEQIGGRLRARDVGTRASRRRTHREQLENAAASRARHGDLLNHRHTRGPDHRRRQQLVGSVLVSDHLLTATVARQRHLGDDDAK